MNKFFIYCFNTKEDFESNADNKHYEIGYSEEHYKQIVKDLFVKKRIYHVVIKNENDKYVEEFNIKQYKF